MSRLWPSPEEIYQRYRERGAALFSDLQYNDIEVFVESWVQMKEALEENTDEARRAALVRLLKRQASP